MQTIISPNARALRVAHALYKNLQSPITNDQSPITNRQWSGVVKYAWYFERLRRWMSTDIVAFSYWKNDGTIREARGTLNPELIPEDKRPKGTFAGIHQPAASFAYFDLDKQQWRSFTLDNFIGFVSIGG